MARMATNPSKYQLKLPEDIFEELRLQSYLRRVPISEIVINAVRKELPITYNKEKDQQQASEISG